MKALCSALRPVLIVAGLAAAPLAAPLAAQAADSVSIDIFAIPSQPIVDTVAGVSSSLKADGMTSFFEKGHAVHATLYLTNYPTSAEPALKKAVQALAARQKPFPLAVGGIEVTKSNWVFLGVDRTPALQRLADLATLAAEPLRDHSVEAPGWMKQYPEKLPAFDRYGSPNVFMQFQPHLTLLANEDNPKLADFAKAEAANPPRGTGMVEGIGIGLADANGQITKVLAEYRFDGATGN